VNKANAEENEAIAEYVDFYLSDDGLATVDEVGYVSLTDDAIEETRGIWEARTAGTQVG
jgi:ABC-type phosphate transport system substrate-binding protein